MIFSNIKIPATNLHYPTYRVASCYWGGIVRVYHMSSRGWVNISNEDCSELHYKYQAGGVDIVVGPSGYISRRTVLLGGIVRVYHMSSRGWVNISNEDCSELHYKYQAEKGLEE
ncbi:hypothetical protein JYU34_015312 [Plutella xylostella]|uniref:Uncharacterized protein n=1 Tax=Plutella xylostella TaxID=51655 RepID=A0ABQ7Q6T9_PLUXY|nr:hypothetical protein JYU34_015312 [Plutella xylostella]